MASKALVLGTSIGLTLTLSGCWLRMPAEEQFKVMHSDSDWHKILSPKAYSVMREQDTEDAFKNVYWDNHAVGEYVCAGCGNELFTSATKYDSKTGWPSFFQPVRKDAVTERIDHSFGIRTEVICSQCGGHLGHVFKDGPKPTGLRYCMNSASLKFMPKNP
ncbi:MAG: peptide-methionine (R)-S-oxide reductase MsrB [Armatimonadetes bacterium]|nr:peptide-methionine (R)-S-oxide reductase MsrB [Armatimonadota bacterium]